MDLGSLLTFIRGKSEEYSEIPSNCKSCNYDQDCFEYFNIVIDDGYYCNHNYQGNTGCCMKNTSLTTNPRTDDEFNSNQQSNQQRTKLINSINKKQNKK